MPIVSDKVMFEIYRDAAYDRQVRVVYFTELDDHNKESEINRAMSGEHIYDGFLAGRSIDQAKQAVAALVARLNAGEALPADAIEAELADYAAD